MKIFAKIPQQPTATAPLSKKEKATNDCEKIH